MMEPADGQTKWTGSRRAMLLKAHGTMRGNAVALRNCGRLPTGLVVLKHPETAVLKGVLVQLCTLHGRISERAGTHSSCSRSCRSCLRTRRWLRRSTSRCSVLRCRLGLRATELIGMVVQPHGRPKHSRGGTPYVSSSMSTSRKPWVSVLPECCKKAGSLHARSTTRC